MKSNFLSRNKKKSLLAALLLFLRERKVLTLLVFLVFIASSVFLSPSYWITGLPGGTRLAAGVAWIAGKMGVDVSQWGLGGGRHSFHDLTAAFASAKANSGKGAIGWGAFFGLGRSPVAAEGGQDSLGFVKGSKSDLESRRASSKAASGAGAGAADSGVAGAVSPEEAKADKNANVVALGPNDVGGEREGWVRNAFAGGFVGGLLGGAVAGAAGGGEAALSGGPFASKGFFAGKGGAAADPNGLAKNGLSTLTPIAVPKSRIQGAANGKLSSYRSNALQTRAMQGAAAASSIGDNRAFTQLAEGRGRAALATTPNCTPPGCPGEFATTNTGAVYDGNRVGGAGTGLIIAPTVDGVQTPNIPDAGIAQGYENQANQMDADAKKCQALDAQYGPTELSLNQQMSSLSEQFKSAGCGSGGCSKSKANYCKGLGDRLKSTCNQYMNARCSHTHACPLTATANCSNECQQGGNGGTGNATSVHVNSGASGNSDGSGMTTVPQ